MIWTKSFVYLKNKRQYRLPARKKNPTSIKELCQRSFLRNRLNNRRNSAPKKNRAEPARAAKATEQQTTTKPDMTNNNSPNVAIKSESPDWVKGEERQIMKNHLLSHNLSLFQQLNRVGFKLLKVGLVCINHLLIVHVWGRLGSGAQIAPGVSDQHE